MKGLEDLLEDLSELIANYSSLKKEEEEFLSKDNFSMAMEKRVVRKKIEGMAKIKIKAIIRKRHKKAL